MSSNSNANKHLTIDERHIIETGIRNGSSKKSIAQTLGKDPSTIGKEIQLHRIKTYSCSLPLECANYKHCTTGRKCTKECERYVEFYCKRRDRTPGACNGCNKSQSCHFNHFMYKSEAAQYAYTSLLSSSREGINISEAQLIEWGNILKPLLDNGLSPYAALAAHPEIKMSEATVYNYIEQNVFRNVGIDINNFSLHRKVSRKPMKKRDQNEYKVRKDFKYLTARKYSDYENFIQHNPNASVVQMDTVYNDITNGPFLQTFKFMKYGFMIIIYREAKDAQSMYEGILLLEEILGRELFEKEAQVILTDRGTEFTKADDIETREDGTTRTRIFYCDPMASCQKGSLEQNHEDIRYVLPKETDLRGLGFTCQKAANLLTSHINSKSKEKLNGKSPLELLEFLNPDMFKKLKEFGIFKVNADNIVLRPYLLKDFRVKK